MELAARGRARVPGSAGALTRLLAWAEAPGSLAGTWAWIPAHVLPPLTIGLGELHFVRVTGALWLAPLLLQLLVLRRIRKRVADESSAVSSAAPALLRYAAQLGWLASVPGSAVVVEAARAAARGGSGAAPEARPAARFRRQPGQPGLRSAQRAAPAGRAPAACAGGVEGTARDARARLVGRAGRGRGAVRAGHPGARRAPLGLPRGRSDCERAGDPHGPAARSRARPPPALRRGPRRQRRGDPPRGGVRARHGLEHVGEEHAVARDRRQRRARARRRPSLRGEHEPRGGQAPHQHGGGGLARARGQPFPGRAAPDEGDRRGRARLTRRAARSLSAGRDPPGDEHLGASGGHPRGAPPPARRRGRRRCDHPRSSPFTRLPTWRRGLVPSTSANR